jgi:short-subunit dehydrogenase
MYIVTGSSSGLGFEISKCLMGKGKSVVGLSRSLGKAAIFADHGNFRHINYDLSSEEGFSRLDQVVSSEPDSPLTLVINAALFEYEGDDLADVSQAETMFRVNYFGAIALVNKLISKNLKRVLFVNSVAGKYPQDGQGQYSASKHALQAYSEVLAKYSVGRDFDVMSINPGGINSELWNNSELLTQEVVSSFINPADLAELVCTFLFLPSKTYIKSFIILPEHDV